MVECVGRTVRREGSKSCFGCVGQTEGGGGSKIPACHTDIIYEWPLIKRVSAEVDEIHAANDFVKKKKEHTEALLQKEKKIDRS